MRKKEERKNLYIQDQPLGLLEDRENKEDQTSIQPSEILDLHRYAYTLAERISTRASYLQLQCVGKGVEECSQARVHALLDL